MKRLVYLHFFGWNVFLIVLTVGVVAQQTVSGGSTAETEIIPESGKVYVIGAVVKAGTFPFDKSDTVSRAIDKGQELSANADIRRIEICRRVEAGNKDNSAIKSFFVNLEAIRRREEKDVNLKPNDVVYVFSTNSTNGTCENTLLGLPPTGISY